MNIVNNDLVARLLRIGGLNLNDWVSDRMARGGTHHAQWTSGIASVNGEHDLAEKMCIDFAFSHSSDQSHEDCYSICPINMSISFLHIPVK